MSHISPEISNAHPEYGEPKVMLSLFSDKDPRQEL